MIAKIHENITLLYVRGVHLKPGCFISKLFFVFPFCKAEYRIKNKIPISGLLE
jgi:hypothetical protein